MSTLVYNCCLVDFPREKGKARRGLSSLRKGASFGFMCWTTAQGLEGSPKACLPSLLPPAGIFLIFSHFCHQNGFIRDFLSYPDTSFHLSIELWSSECKTKCNSITSLVMAIYALKRPQILASIGKENAPDDAHSSQHPTGVLGRKEVRWPAPKRKLFISYLAISWHPTLPL